MPSNYFYEFGPFRFNPVKGILLRDREPVPQFPPRSSELLQLLIEHRDRIVPRDEIMTKIWGITVTVGNSALDYQVSALRDSLKDDAENPQYIKTFRRRGIKFVATVKIVIDDSQEAFYEKAGDPASVFVDTQTDASQSEPASPVKSVKTSTALFAATLSVLLAGLVWLMFYARHRTSVPQINTIAVTTVAQPKHEFTVQIEGTRFEPDIVQVVIVGPGCKRFGPCTVPNGVLVDYGNVSTNKIERVPLTLDAGEFQLYVQNGKEGPASNPLILVIPSLPPR